MLLPVRYVDKVWGQKTLPAPFSNTENGRIGEIWFEPPPVMPDLLVKYLFTSDWLSVQVHPSDEQSFDGKSGKEECWYILDAEPDAVLAIGLKQPLAKPAVREAALDGTLKDQLEWHRVKPGDFFYLPAGTIHAIGPGISLIEVQQNSDVTYRLYDYGRPRELHLDAAMKVARCDTYPGELKRHVSEGVMSNLCKSSYFSVDYIAGDAQRTALANQTGPTLLIPLSGVYRTSSTMISPGRCALVEQADELTWSPDASALLAYV